MVVLLSAHGQPLTCRMSLWCHFHVWSSNYNWWWYCEKAPLPCIMPSCHHAWWYPWSLLNPSLKKRSTSNGWSHKSTKVNLPDLGEAKSSKPLTREEWKFIKSLTSATTGNSCSSLGLVRKNQWQTEQSRQATTTSNWQFFRKKKLKRFVEAVAVLFYHRHLLEEKKFVWNMKQQLLNMLEQLEIYLAGVDIHRNPNTVNGQWRIHIYFSDFPFEAGSDMYESKASQKKQHFLKNTWLRKSSNHFIKVMFFT